MMMRDRRKMIWLAPLIAAGFVAFAILGGWIVMTLWNWLMPELLGWHTLRLPQALALLVLCRILFGGFGMHGGGPRANLKRRLYERWEGMSDEERAKFREGMRGTPEC